MRQALERFIHRKNLSVNTRQSYFYDIQQFLEQCQEVITPQTIALYQAFLSSLKPTVSRRKQSSVNQFLLFLYEEGLVERFYKVRVSQGGLPQTREKPALEDLGILYRESAYKQGQLLALLIVELGLTPSEIRGLETKHIDVSFRVVTVERFQQKRVLPLSEELVAYLRPQMGATYLFDRGEGQPYSRQWFFLRLQELVEASGHPQWTARFLREQYIRRQLQAGQSLDQLAKQMGLKSSLSLEKYKEWI